MNVTLYFARIAGLLFCGLLVIALTGSAANNDRVRAGSVSCQQNGADAPAAPVDQDYPVSTGHWVGLVMDQGAKVKLEDGSVWEIADKDHFQTRDWRIAQKISVSRNPNERYQFALTNTDHKTSADARLAYRPK